MRQVISIILLGIVLGYAIAIAMLIVRWMVWMNKYPRVINREIRGAIRDFPDLGFPLMLLFESPAPVGPDESHLYPEDLAWIQRLAAGKKEKNAPAIATQRTAKYCQNLVLVAEKCGVVIIWKRPLFGKNCRCWFGFMSAHFDD